MKTIGWSAPVFVVAFAAAALLPAHIPVAFAQAGQKDYGTRKPACGCYVCGSLLSVHFGESDCAGILAEDACGDRLGGLPQDKRAGFCQKLKAQFGPAAFTNSCRAYALYCGPETTTAKGPASGGTASPGMPGGSAGGQGPTTPKEPPPKPGKGGPDSTKGKEVPIVAGSPGQKMVGSVTGGSSGSKTVQPVSPSSTAQAASASSTAKAASSSTTTQAVPFPLASLRVDPQSVIGGTRVEGTVELVQAPGPAGLTVKLESSNPKVAAMPSSITITHGVASADTGAMVTGTFGIDTNGVIEKETIVVTARAGAQTLQANLYVRKPAIVSAQLLGPGLCDGHKKATVKYTLNGPAPSGLKVYAYVEVVPGGRVERGETVPAGNSAGSFKITPPRCQKHNPGERCSMHGAARVVDGQGDDIGGSCDHPPD